MKTNTTIGWIILLLACLTHVSRVIAQAPLTINGYAIPMSISWLVFMVLGVITLGMWREYRKKV